MTPSLIQTLASPLIWRGCDAVSPQQIVDCGFTPLSAVLAGGGWRVGATTELLLARPGVGELQLLAPALRCLHQQQRAVAVVHPPFLPHLPAWQALGLTPDLLLWLSVSALPRRLWALEQLLRSGSCGAVLGWLPELNVTDRDIRRLQQAAAHGNCMHVLLRPQRVAHTVSASACRLLLKPEQHALIVRVIKQRGRNNSAACRIQLPLHHAQMPVLPPWQWPLPRANQHTPEHTTDSTDSSTPPPLTDSVSFGG